MVLGKHYFKDNATELAKDWRDYTIVKHNYFRTQPDTETFREGVQVWGLINSLRLINNLFEKAKIDRLLDYSILFEVLTAIDSNKPFTMAQMERYFKLLQEVEDFSKFLGVLDTNLIEDLYIGSGADLILIGFDLHKYYELERLDKELAWKTMDDIFDIKWSAIKGEISIKAYIERALETLNNALDKAGKANNKDAA